LPYLRDKDSLPTDSVQFALTETRSSILDLGSVQFGAEPVAVFRFDFVSYARHIDASDVVSPGRKKPTCLKAA
jgi:hypothetical protein